MTDKKVNNKQGDESDFATGGSEPLKMQKIKSSKKKKKKKVKKKESNSDNEQDD